MDNANRKTYRKIKHRYTEIERIKKIDNNDELFEIH